MLESPHSPKSVEWKRDAAAYLAAELRSVDDGLVAIYRIESPGQESDPSEPIKLLLIDSNTNASGYIQVRMDLIERWVSNHPIVVVQIHPSEVAELRVGDAPLPHGWLVDWDRPM